MTTQEAKHDIMDYVHAFVPVHDGCVEFADKLAREMKRPDTKEDGEWIYSTDRGIGELIWSNDKRPLKQRIGELRADGYINIHVIGDKEMNA